MGLNSNYSTRYLRSATQTSISYQPLYAIYYLALPRDLIQNQPIERNKHEIKKKRSHSHLCPSLKYRKILYAPQCMLETLVGLTFKKVASIYSFPSKTFPGGLSATIKYCHHCLPFPTRAHAVKARQHVVVDHPR